MLSPAYDNAASSLRPPFRHHFTKRPKLAEPFRRACDPQHWCPPAAV